VQHSLKEETAHPCSMTLNNRQGFGFK